MSTQSNVPSTQSYQVPTGWQKYTDGESGITVYYPPHYIAKYNPNRGSGISYAAGSYLVDSSGDKMLDFYKFPYSGGSRREAYYDHAEFDGPEDMSQFTISTTDVILNGRKYLKLVSNYWTKYRNEGNRVFFLTPQGNQMYYFTYPASLESNTTDYKNILTIIATSNLTEGTGTNSNQYISCYARPNSNNINDSWEAKIENGDMVITQRTDNKRILITTFSGRINKNIKVYN